MRARPTARDILIAKFPQGLPGFKKGDQRGWSLKRQGGTSGRVSSDAARVRERGVGGTGDGGEEGY